MLRLPPGPVDLSAVDPASTPGFLGTKEAAEEDLRSVHESLADAQERLYAHGRTGGRKNLLLVVQGMDTAGKGGVVKHVAGALDPQGVHIQAFGAPTERELRHDFLWRIAMHVPGGGTVGIFDRSHYEDVLIGKVHKLAPADEIERRYGAINDFERELAGTGTTFVKVMLHISRDEQYERLKERLDNPAKHWKFDPEDLVDREQWKDYQRAYEIALERCNTDHAPWHVVPANHKWYRDWALTHLVAEHLASLDLGWPKASFDVSAEAKRLKDLK